MKEELPTYLSSSEASLRFKITKKKNLGGFTLIEAMVSIAIILVLSSVLLLNYRDFHYQFCLLRSAYKLSHDLRAAQEMAVSAKELSSGGVPPGYGIYLEVGVGQISYALYADTNPLGGNEKHDIGENTSILYLEEGVYIEEIYVIYVEETFPASSLSVNFSGPDPITNIDFSDASYSSARITLALESDPTKKQEIFVNEVGLIYVE